MIPKFTKKRKEVTLENVLIVYIGVMIGVIIGTVIIMFLEMLGV